MKKFIAFGKGFLKGLGMLLMYYLGFVLLFIVLFGFSGLEDMDELWLQYQSPLTILMWLVGIMVVFALCHSYTHIRKWSLPIMLLNIWVLPLLMGAMEIEQESDFRKKLPNQTKLDS